MGREVQLESEMVQEKRARLDEKNSMVEKLTKAEKQLEQEKTKAMQSSREMEDIKESMKTQQLINMEMKDYERAVNELKNQLELKTNESNSAVQGKNQWFVLPKLSTFVANPGKLFQKVFRNISFSGYEPDHITGKLIKISEI